MRTKYPKTISVPSAGLKRRGGVVVLTLPEYEKMRKKIERLEREKETTEEEARILKIIAEGEQEYRGGKLKPLKSLADLD